MISCTPRAFAAEVPPPPPEPMMSRPEAGTKARRRPPKAAEDETSLWREALSQGVLGAHSGVEEVVEVVGAAGLGAEAAHAVATEGLAPLIRHKIWAALARIRAEGVSILVVDKNVADLIRLADEPMDIAPERRLNPLVERVELRRRRAGSNGQSRLASWRFRVHDPGSLGPSK